MFAGHSPGASHQVVLRSSMIISAKELWRTALGYRVLLMHPAGLQHTNKIAPRGSYFVNQL
jgi:hypothetical protein